MSVPDSNGEFASMESMLFLNKSPWRILYSKAEDKDFDPVDLFHYHNKVKNRLNIITVRSVKLGTLNKDDDVV